MMPFPLPVIVKAPSLPALTVRGEQMVDPAGKAVTLRGANMGNWLLLEFWMLGLSDPKNGGYGDQYSFEKILADRFGVAEKERFMNLYRENFVTERDWRYMQQAKFNLVRLPFNYRLLEDDEKPYQLRPNAFRWLDKAVDEAEKHGMYTILDLHGIQGGQTENDHTGRSGQNKLWSVPENQKRAAWLWTQIAKRYKNRSAVVAYDVFNEPYGGKRDEQLSVFRQLYAGVRKSDPDKLVFAHGHYDGFSHYGDPKAQGWKNVGFEMHYYPALFGDSRPVPKAHGQHLAEMALVEKEQNRLNVPFLVGEFNAVFAPLAPGIMRRHYDTYAKNGWMATMWSYKVMGSGGGIGGGNWGLVTNAEPLAKLDVRTADKAAIEGWMKRLSTIELMPWAELMTALSDPNYVPAALPEPPPAITVAPAHDALPGWETMDVNAMAGGQKIEADGTIRLYGGGNDIWGREDGFRFASKEATGNFELEAEVVSLRDTNAYAKAGLMVRAGTDKDAAMLLLSVFPSGTAQTAFRAAKGAEAVGGEGADGPLPTRLRLVRKAGKVEAFAQHAGAAWKSLGTSDLPGTVRFGLVALSHDDRQLTEAVYRDVKVK